jgi:Tfp pilus assembly protein PilV
MKRLHKESGFALVEIVLVVIVLALIGFVGYVFVNNQMHGTASKNTAQTTTASAAETAPVINTTSDLDKAQATLDANDPSTSTSSDSSQLDSDLSNF